MTPGIFASRFHLALGKVHVFVFSSLTSAAPALESIRTLCYAVDKITHWQQSCKPRASYVSATMHERSKSLSMTPSIFASWFHLARGTVRVFVINGFASERVREIDSYALLCSRPYCEPATVVHTRCNQEDAVVGSTPPGPTL